MMLGLQTADSFTDSAKLYEKAKFGSSHTGVFGKSGGAMFVPSNAYNSVM